ncbi:MAG: DUF2652 domain-containing protein [Deltaproteobacteria bacterium]|nr:DUF2652 domain-containing protein [Deltaproteobacteria bacterium]
MLVRTKLLRFFEVFLEGMVTASESTPCKCAVCSNAGELSLKVIVHSGSAVFHSIGGRAQVSGPDVILTHRLLKNSVQGNEYLLMSESAYRDLGSQMNLEFVEGQEAYAEFGTLKTHVHLMGEEVEQTRKSLYSLKPAALASRARQYLVWGSRLQLTAMIEQIRHPHAEASGPARLMFVFLVLLATPLVFLAGLFTIPRKLLSRQKALARSGGRGAKEPSGASLSG